MVVKHREGDGAQRLRTALRDIQGRVVKVGWVKEKRYEDSDMTTAQVGAIAERGDTKHRIPARPVVAPAIVQNKIRWQKIANLEAKKVFNGETTANNMFEVLGAEAAGAVRYNITRLIDPPLSPKTIAARERQYAGRKLLLRVKDEPNLAKRRKAFQARKKQKAQRMAMGKLTKPLVFTKVFLNSCTHVVEKE